METAVLQADKRTDSGSRAAFNLRRDGRLPAIIYGEGKPVVSVSVPTHEFEAALRHHSRVLELHVDGEKEDVLIHDVQWNLMGDSLVHVDFKRLIRGTKIDVTVELEFVGHPKGLSHGGEFNKHLADLAVRCRPSLIPETIRVLVSELDLGESIHVRDLELPEGVEPVGELDELVCSMQTRAAIPDAEEEGEGEDSAEPEVISKGKGEEDGEG